MKTLQEARKLAFDVGQKLRLASTIRYRQRKKKIP